MNGLPKYVGRFERPAKFEADPGKYERLAFRLFLKDSIMCFEQYQTHETVATLQHKIAQGDDEFAQANSEAQ